MAFIWKLFANFSQCNTFPYIFFIVLCENVCCLLNWPGFAQSTPLILLPNLFLSLKHMARATSRSQVDKSPTQCCDMLQKVSPFMMPLSSTSRLMLSLPSGKSVMNISLSSLILWGGRVNDYLYQYVNVIDNSISQLRVLIACCWWRKDSTSLTYLRLLQQSNVVYIVCAWFCHVAELIKPAHIQYHQYLCMWANEHLSPGGEGSECERSDHYLPCLYNAFSKYYTTQPQVCLGKW